LGKSLNKLQHTNCLSVKAEASPNLNFNSIVLQMADSLIILFVAGVCCCQCQSKKNNKNQTSIGYQ